MAKDRGRMSYRNNMKMLFFLEEACILKIVQEGEKEYREQKLKPIRCLSELLHEKIPY